MKNAYLIQFEKYVDERGALIPFEYNKNCPFDVKRCFFVYNIPTFSRRGNHINIKSKNLQSIICEAITNKKNPHNI